MTSRRSTTGRAAWVAGFFGPLLAMLTLCACADDSHPASATSSSTGSGGAAGGAGSGGSGGASTGAGGASAGGGGAGEGPWSFAVNGASNDEALALAVDPSGALLVLSASDGPVDWGGGALPPNGGVDPILTKHHPNGDLVWSKRFGGPEFDAARAVASDAAGAIVIAGGFGGSASFGGPPLVATWNEDGFVAKLDALGEHVWSRGFGAGRMEAVAIDAAGALIVVGECMGATNDFGGGPLPGGPYDFCVAKLDGWGGHVWSRRFAGGAYQLLLGVAVDARGRVVLAGWLASPTDFGGGPIGPAAGRSAFLVALDVAGQHLWSAAYGDQDTAFSAVAHDPSGDAVAVGWLSGTADLGGGPLTALGERDVLVARFDAAGQHIFSKHFGSPLGGAGASDVAIQPSGVALVGGDLGAPIDFGAGPIGGAGSADVLLLELSATGEVVSARAAGDDASQYITAVATSPTGAAYVTGVFEGTLDLGQTPLESADPYDAFVARIH